MTKEKTPVRQTHMELRKIQLTGGSSFTVTLPKEWVTRSKLDAGDLVGFAQLPDGNLGVYAHAKEGIRPERCEIEISDDDSEGTFRKIVAAYLVGHDVIVLKSKRPLLAKHRQAVRNAAKRIIGIEVVEEEPNTVVLQDFLDPREFHIDKALRRMEALTRTMQEDALRAFRTGPEDAVESLTERDDEVDRLHWMINKQYHALLREPAYAQKMNLNPHQALDYLVVARLIERIADHATGIAVNLEALRGGELRAKLETKIEKQARRAFQLFSTALTAFHKRDTPAANKLIGEVKEFERSQDTLIKDSLSLGGEEILHVAYALESIGRTAAYASDIAETAINHDVVMK
jgi:phosphate uptake regulator